MIYLQKFNVEVTFVAGQDPQEWADATRPNTKLYYLESPSSLVFNLQDLKAMAALAKERGIITAIDNSWASPYFQNPIEHGIDLVLHSATKYLGGHSDVVMGALVTNNEKLHQELAFIANSCGAVPGPQDSFLVLRGIKTLHLRMERHCSNGPFGYWKGPWRVPPNRDHPTNRTGEQLRP